MYELEFEGTIAWFQNPDSKVSSQLIIGREENQTVRVIPDSMQAWHAAEDNARAWGIELEQGVESDGFTEPQMRQLIRAARS